MTLRRVGLSNSLSSQAKISNKRFTLSRVSLRRFPFPTAAAAAAVVNYVEEVFSTYLYTGTGASQSINNGIDLSGKGGLVWLKQRSAVSWTAWTKNFLCDTTRGAGQALFSDSTSAQDNTGTSTLSSFTSTGFNLGNDGSGYGVNKSTEIYASWTFREQAKFFDIVTYTGNGAASRNINHNLGSTPGCIICKATSITDNWGVYHRSTGANGLYLNATNSAGVTLVPTGHTSTTFEVADGYGINNANGVTYVAYLFAHDAGGFGATGSDNVISCGSFSYSSGFTSYSLGYEPQWIMVKRTNSTGNWFITDIMRGAANDATNDNQLNPNTSSAELAGFSCYPTATGFTIEGLPAGDYIYIAIRRGPMKTPTSGTSVFSPVARTGTGSAASITGVGFPPDLVVFGPRSIAENKYEIDRLRGASEGLITNSTSGGISLGSLLTLNIGGISMSDGNSAWNQNAATYVNWFFGRAPGFFDVVCYTGNGSASQTVNHNLGVVPELMIVKRRDSAGGWIVYFSGWGDGRRLVLQSSSALISADSSIWNNTEPTSTQFTVGSSLSTGSATYINYLFDSCPGVSKVGSYTGTGTTQQVDCGFTSGARFVLIKRTDSTGDWYVWDSARGIIAGNDPYLLLNSSAFEVTNTDYVDTYNAGFEISSTAPAAINASGGTFIFLAIA